MVVVAFVVLSELALDEDCLSVVVNELMVSVKEDNLALFEEGTLDFEMDMVKELSGIAVR